MKKIELTKQDKKEILEVTKFTSRKHKKTPYQTIGNIKGIRDTELRYKFMNLPEDFKGKSVLDIGCNLGSMCHASKSRGAGRVVGLDYNTSLLETSSNIFKRHNYDISLISYDFNKQGYDPLLKILGEEKFDYVFALSIYYWIKDKSVLWNIINNYCGDTFWFEGHKRNSKEGLQKELLLNLNAKKISYIGNIKDHVSRAIFKGVM